MVGKIILIFLLLCNLSMLTMALDMDTVNTLANAFGFVRPWLACPRIMSNQSKSSLRAGLVGRTLGIAPDLPGIMDYSRKGQFAGQNVLICIDDFLADINRNESALSLASRIVDAFDGNAVRTNWIVGKCTSIVFCTYHQI